MFHPDPNVRSIEERNMVWAAKACSFMRELDPELLKHDNPGKFAFQHTTLEDLLELREIDLLVICAMTTVTVVAEGALLKTRDPKQVYIRFDSPATRIRLLLVDTCGMLVPVAQEQALLTNVIWRTHLTQVQALLLLRATMHFLSREPPQFWGHLAFERLENGVIQAKLASF